MNRVKLIIFILFVLFGAFGIAFYFQNRPIVEQSIQETQPVQPQKPIKKTIIHHRVPKIDLASKKPTTYPEPVGIIIPPAKSPVPEVLPSLQKSDQSILEALESLLNNRTILKLLRLENVIQRFVVTIDNLPETRLPRAHLALSPPKGKFLVAGTPEAPQTSSRNHQRYTVYLNFLEAIDQDLAIKTYVRFYPLFQKAYRQLGYKNAYFNDRLVYVIDHLLTTPNLPDPIQLSQPAVLYTYADPNLEKLSVGQKLLLRIGYEQRSKVLSILNEYRKKLTNLQPK